MQCPQCQHENRDDALFCEECAAPLRHVCSSCGRELRPAAKFCDSCATPVAGPASEADVRVATSERPADAERRQLTVMFCDLVGSTALSQRLDAEELREIVRAYQAAAATAIARFDGHIAAIVQDIV